MKTHHIFIFLILLTLFLPHKIYAETCQDSSSCENLDPPQKLVCLSSLTSKCQILLDNEQKKLDIAQQKESNLNNTLDILDVRSKLIQLKTDETNTQIAVLNQEINTLSYHTKKLSDAMQNLFKILDKRIIQTYKYSSLNTIDVLFSSTNVSDFLKRLKYMQVAQASDKKILYQLQSTKTEYDKRKKALQSSQIQAEKLSKELAVYQIQLDQNKKAQEQVLEVTKNDEARYQAIINQLRAEVASLTQALSNVGVKIGSVNKGDIIAAMGSTGCSTGPHLHFETYERAKVENGKVVDKNTGVPVANNPWAYLVNPHNYLDNGKLGPPLDGYPQDTEITTEFHQWYQFFGGSYHTGIDIIPKGAGERGSTITAVANGIAYATSGICSYPPVGGSSLGKGIIIDHQNGVVTLYWHIL